MGNTSKFITRQPFLGAGEDRHSCKIQGQAWAIQLGPVQQKSCRQKEESLSTTRKRSQRTNQDKKYLNKPGSSRKQ